MGYKSSFKYPTLHYNIKHWHQTQQCLVIFPGPCDSVISLSYFEDPNNCRSYYMCNPGMEPFILTCLAGHSFDETINACVLDPFCP
jgi:hypothetical protein